MAARRSGDGRAASDAARELAAGITAGDPRAIARGISHVEDDTPIGRDLLDQVYARAGQARRVGVTGPPGSGKSTLVNALAELLRADGRRVAVLAIDPTSPFTGGAILGDRVRMTAASGDPDLFVRSMASRGSVGGVSSATYEASEILAAAGFDWILIETVGVGQSELEIVELADTVILLLVPESGDAVQVMKAGIMEIADLFVVNKYDREGGDRLVRDIQLAMELTDWERTAGWRPPVCPAVALQGVGIDAVLTEARRHYDWLLGDAERLERTRSEKMTRRMRMLLNKALLEHAWEEARIEEKLQAAITAIAQRRTSPYRWVNSVLSQWRRCEED